MMLKRQVEEREIQLNIVRSRGRNLVASATVALIVPVLVNAGGFTQEQATNGKSLYASQCSQCHGVELEGIDAPALSSETMQNFSTAGGLYDMISVAMPPQAPGELSEDQYLSIMAYILSFNGAQPDEVALVADYDVLDSIDLVAVTSVAPDAHITESSDEGSIEAVPQAFTWGKPLPGSDLFTQSSEMDTTENAVPQAYTWGKELPTVEQ